MFEIANEGIIQSTNDLDRIAKYAIDEILRWTGGDAERAHCVAEKLALLDWQQVITEKQEDKIKHQMWAMKTFLADVAKGGGFCAWCDDFHSKLYYWPYTSADYCGRGSFGWVIGGEQVRTGQRLCWKCFYKLQDNVNFDKHLWRCTGCDRFVPEKALFRVGKEIVGNRYCLHCVESATEKQFAICEMCEKKTANPSKGMCYDCRDFYAKCPTPSLFSHLERARKAGNPATLTARQWATTVKYFDGKCAYCRVRPYDVLEHFLPIILGGGTTADNCVPACNSCNSLKGCAHPDTFDSIFSYEVIEHIEEYLQGDKQHQVNSFAVKSRALVVYAA